MLGANVGCVLGSGAVWQCTAGLRRGNSVSRCRLTGVPGGYARIWCEGNRHASRVHRRYTSLFLISRVLTNIYLEISDIRIHKNGGYTGT